MKLPGITPEEIQKTVDTLQAEVERVGAARVGWALEKVRGYAHDASPVSEIEKVSSAITKSGLYMRTKNGPSKDYFISLDTSYEMNQNIKWTNRNLIKSTWTITVFTALTFLLTCITTYKSCTEQQSKTPAQADYGKLLDSLQEVKKGIDSSLRALNRDSVQR